MKLCMVDKKSNLESKVKIGLTIVTKDVAVTRSLRFDSAESNRSRGRHALVHRENSISEKEKKMTVTVYTYFVIQSYVAKMKR